jgi:quercetin dioxygenase-like cupin family protein
VPAIRQKLRDLGEKNMKPRNLALAVLIFMSGTAFAGAGSADVVIFPDQINWVSLPFAPGAKVAWLAGAVDKPEIYTIRVHLDAGAKIPPHTHPDTRMITVLSGQLLAGQGAKFGEEATKTYGPGTFFVVPAGAPHFAWAKDGEAVYQESGFGPSPSALIKQ